MRYPKGKKYLSTEAEQYQFLLGIKWILCPHCGRVGYLNGHGFLRGYAEDGQAMVMRGRRFFCSNRYRSQGCGGTFSVLLADMLVGFMVRTRTLFAFLKGVADGLSRKAAWESAAPTFTLEGAYRLWRKLGEALPHIRTLLSRQRPPPASASAEPLVQMLEHLLGVFPSADCPFASFQAHFQVPLLG